jgi:hypothetical protein
MLETAAQYEKEIYRVIILDRSGTEVLVVPGRGGIMLPAVRIPRWQRVAEKLTAAVKADWGAEVICLFTPKITGGIGNGDRIHYLVTEHWRDARRPCSATQWMQLSALSQDSFVARCDYSAMQQSIFQFNAATHQPLTHLFARLGWFKDLRGWVEAVIKPRGLHLDNDFQQLNASPSFSLMRFETDGPAIWFKAVDEPNRREFPITCALAQLFPKYLPPILATRSDCNGWLAQEVEGTNLGETEEITLWEAASVAAAKLQIESISHSAPVLTEGAHDLRDAALSDHVQPFMKVMAQLMEQQAKISPPVLGQKELVLLGDQIQEALEMLRGLEIPDALGHLDLNPGNIIASPKQCFFLDWAEAYVGNPFFSFEYLLEHRRRTSGTDSAVEARLIDSYCAQWEVVVPRADAAEALVLAPLLAVFAYAAGSNAWKDPERLQDPVIGGYLRSLTRRMNREANRLADRRSACLD